MEKKRKWERDYEKYLASNELDERIEYLQDLINGKVALKEEYEEHKKLTAIKANLPKVKNILELRGKLEEERKEINQEIARRELIGKCEKAIKLLEDEMTKLEEEHSNIEKEMKANPEKKAELQTKLAENEKKRQENNVKFGNTHERLRQENEKTEQSKFKETSLEDLKNKAISISSHISQCNLACNKLMQGYSWQSVEVALDKFKGERLTAKDADAKKMQQNREAAKADKIERKPAKAENYVEEEPELEGDGQPELEGELQPEEEHEEKAIAKVTIWQKVKNFGRNLWEKAKKFFKGDEVNEQPEDQPENQPENQPEKVEEVQPAKKEDTFRQYLRDVAAKGIDGVEQERLDAEKAEKEARRQAAIEKYNASRAGKDIGARITNLEKDDGMSK